MKTPPKQTASNDDMQLLNTVSKLIIKAIPKDAEFVCLVIIPGGETGVKIRLCSKILNAEDWKIHAYLREAARFAEDHEAQFVELPEDN